MYAGGTSISYANATSVNEDYVNNLSVRSLQGLLDFTNKNEKITSLNIKTILKTFNDIHHQLFAASIQVTEIYPELKKITFARSS